MEMEGMEQQASKLESNCFLPNFKISIFVDELGKMSKTTALDLELSQVLNEFLEKLAECEPYIEQGIMNMNFAEAALLLQSSADVYNKKVEMLWDAIFDCQKRMLQCEEKNDGQNTDLEKLEERKRKYKRKRRTNADETQTVKLVNDFSFGNVENVDYLNLNLEPIDLSAEWSKFQINSSQDDQSFTQSSNKTLFAPTTNIYNEDNDYIGRYDQFHSFTLLGDNLQLENEYNSANNCPTEVVVDIKGRVDNFTKQINKDLTTIKDLERLCCKKSFVSLERLPFNVLKDQLRRCSMADSLFDDDCISLSSNHCTSPVQHEESEKGRSKSCSQDSAFYDDEHFDSIDDGLVEEANVLETSVQTTTENPTTKTVPKTTNQENDVTDVETSKDLPLCLSSCIIIPKAKKVRLETVKEKNSKRIKLDRKAKMPGKRMLKLAMGVTVNYREFEQFFRVQYKPGEGEGTPELDLSESEESESSDEEQFHDNGPMLEQEENENNDTVEDTIDESSFRNEEEDSRVTQSRKESRLETSFSVQHEDITRSSVQEWRSFIMPKLKALNNKSDFDIHEYGSQIIEPSQIGEERHFKDIVKGKSAAEVARYFIATLQLANTNNVEIKGGIPGELANDTFQIKTIDKTKHHEMLEDYQAPSEETFRERLEIAKSRNPKLQLHSTPTRPPFKKIKLSRFHSHF